MSHMSRRSLALLYTPPAFTTTRHQAISSAPCTSLDEDQHVFSIFDSSRL